MRGESIFAGGWRRIPAAAFLVTRESVRSGAFALLVLAYLVYMATYRTSVSGDTSAAVARFPDHAFSGASTLVLLCSVFLALGAGRRRGGDAGDGRRLMGAANWYWGRVVGAVLVLAALGFVFAVIAVVHFGARFGDFGGSDFSLERRVTSPSFGREDEPLYLREVGATAELPFVFDAADAQRGAGGHVVRGRFSPKLVVARDGEPIRTRYPVKITVRDPEAAWSRSDVVYLTSGREATFWIPLPPRALSGRLQVGVEKLDAAYHLKFTRRDLQLVAGHEPLLRCVFRSAVVLALYGGVLTAVSCFLLARFSWGVAFLASCGLLAVVTSLDVLAVSVLDPLPRGARLTVLEIIRVILPDFDRHDVAGLLSRRIAVTWELVGHVGLRFLVTTSLLGIIEGRWGGRR